MTGDIVAIENWPVVSQSNLGPATGVAVAWQPATSRPALAALLEFDATLGRLVATAHEPIFVQMRLAWWRERLAGTIGISPAADPLLAALGMHWTGAEPVLRDLVDGWEELADETRLSRESLLRFGTARSRSLGAFAQRLGEASSRDSVELAGQRWALADLAFNVSDPQERELALKIAEEFEPPGRLPSSLRGIAVLGALTDRAIARREPLLAGRGAALVALRVGMLGR